LIIREDFSREPPVIDPEGLASFGEMEEGRDHENGEFGDWGRGRSPIQQTACMGNWLGGLGCQTRVGLSL
jgi:hypothetical protein